MKIKKFATVAVESINQLLWPSFCINCGTNICQSENHLCEKCWSELLACTDGEYCLGCGINVSQYGIVNNACPRCQANRFHFDRIIRCGIYDQALKKIILSFKFKDRTELALMLAMLANSALQGSGISSEIDFFVPVPIHWTRRLKRGYNQSTLIAKKLKHRTAIINTDLVRIRRTKAQMAITSPAGRARNVANAFAVRYGHNFENASVCLIDDIKTTGSTLNECAKSLKEAGAKKVIALVLTVASQKVE